MCVLTPPVSSRAPSTLSIGSVRLPRCNNRTSKINQAQHSTTPSSSSLSSGWLFPRPRTSPDINQESSGRLICLQWRPDHLPIVPTARLLALLLSVWLDRRQPPGSGRLSRQAPRLVSWPLETHNLTAASIRHQGSFSQGRSDRGSRLCKGSGCSGMGTIFGRKVTTSRSHG